MNAQQTHGPLSVELSVDLSSNEIALYRQAITQTATDEDWQRSAVMYFASLRERRSRYQVRQIGKGYNAIL
jgi:hypothetical protein